MHLQVVGNGRHTVDTNQFNAIRGGVQREVLREVQVGRLHDRQTKIEVLDNQPNRIVTLRVADNLVVRIPCPIGPTHTNKGVNIRRANRHEFQICGLRTGGRNRDLGRNHETEICCNLGDFRDRQ